MRLIIHWETSLDLTNGTLLILYQCSLHCGPLVPMTLQLVTCYNFCCATYIKTFHQKYILTAEVIHYQCATLVENRNWAD